MKKYLILILFLVLVLTACGKKNDANDVKGSEISYGIKDEVIKSGDTPNTTEYTEPTEVPTPTPTPTPEPTPTPFPTDTVEDYENFAFTYDDATKLYNEPDNPSSYVHMELDANTSIYITGKCGNSWYRVEVDGITGYIKRSDYAMGKGYINADEVNFRKDASRSSDIIKKLDEKTEVIIISTKDDWYKIALADDMSSVGYVSCDYVSYHDAFVTADDVRLREKPNTECKTKTRLSLGKKVAVISQYGEWCKVSVDEYTGYISSEFIVYRPTVTELEKERGYLIENGVNFRVGPSLEYRSMGRLAKFAPVYVTGETDEWYRIIYNEQEGYVSRDFVKLGKLVVYVTAQDVNLRAGPGTNTDLLTKVRKNSKFEIIGCDGEWMKGIVNQNTGYIRSDYLSDTAVDGGAQRDEFTDDEIALAAKVVYLEARGYGAEAYRAVANVIYNRVKSHRFPNTVKGVVFQSGQFSVINHSNFDNISPSSEAYKATEDVLNNGIRPMPFNVLFFHASYLGKNWGSDKQYYKTVGDNSFFRYVG